ncbi:MAG: GNAT family protein [bacterium]|nr:GNAT family protein [bacterium]
MSEFQPMTSRRLTLRRLLPSDGRAVYAYRSRPEEAQFQSWVPKSAHEAEDFIHRIISLEPGIPGTWFQLAITLKDSGELIGDCGLYFPDYMPKQAELGITVSSQYWKKGYAIETLTAALDYLFGEMKLHRVYASTDPNNHPAIRLLEYLGLRKEAHFRQSLWFKNAWADDLVYATLSGEWEKRRRRLG